MKRILTLVLCTLAMVVGLGSMSMVNTSASATTPTPQVDVLTATAKFVGKSKKVKSCKAYAEKFEHPQAPPRDPQALCKGKLKVKLVGKIKTPPCPTGYFGGMIKLRVELRQSVNARAFAKSIANGRVQTWAEFIIRDSAKIKGLATAQCVRVPPTTTPPPPPPHDECPDIPGNQPKGYNCEQPPPVKHFTNVSCTSPEEITVGGSVLVTCGVNNDNGAPIGLTAVSNDANSQVSGVICRDNGAQTCPNGGTFQFRLNGIKQGTTSVNVTASSNGVDKTITVGPMPVDPENGGFRQAA